MPTAGYRRSCLSRVGCCRITVTLSTVWLLAINQAVLTAMTPALKAYHQASFNRCNGLLISNT